VSKHTGTHQANTNILNISVLWFTSRNSRDTSTTHISVARWRTQRSLLRISGHNIRKCT